MLHCRLGEAKPVRAYSKNNLISADFDYGVLWCVEPVSGCVRAKQRSPRGPKLSVNTFLYSLRLYSFDQSDSPSCRSL